MSRMRYVLTQMAGDQTARESVVHEFVSNEGFDRAVTMALETLKERGARLTFQDRAEQRAIFLCPPSEKWTLILAGAMLDLPAKKLSAACSAKIQAGERAAPNGARIFWRMTEQGREYTSDEIGGGILFWHTAMTDASTLIAAVAIEMELQRAERFLAEEKEREQLVGSS